MRARTRAAAAVVGAAAMVLGLAGCVGGETDDGPTGPNGYTLGATVGDATAWYDVGESTGVTDVILTVPARSQPLGVCLGGSGTACRIGAVQEQPYVVLIAPDGASAEVTWHDDEVVEMTRLEPLADGAPAVYVAALPVLEEGTQVTARYRVLDEAGEVVFEQ